MPEIAGALRSRHLQQPRPDAPLSRRDRGGTGAGERSISACASTRCIRRARSPNTIPPSRTAASAIPPTSSTPEHLDGIDGIHIHSLCEQDFPPLRRTWEALRPRLEPYFGQLKWLNFGGGHHITRADYQRDDLVDFLKAVRAETGLDLYLEPGEAVALDAGILVGEVLDVIDNGMPVAILDISATCHMPDVIEAPYRPALLGEPDEGVDRPPRRPLLPRRRRDRRLSLRPPRPSPATASPSSTRPIIRWSRPPPSTASRCPPSRCGTAATTASSIVREFGYEDFEGRLS